MHPTTESTSPSTPLQLCRDGYIRLKEAALHHIPMLHLHSGLHAESDWRCVSNPELNGFTEWYSETLPSISIGWDWRLNILSDPAQFELTGLPFTNLQLQTAENEDYPAQENLMLIKRFIETLQWTPALTKVLQACTENPGRRH